MGVAGNNDANKAEVHTCNKAKEAREEEVQLCK